MLLFSDIRNILYIVDKWLPNRKYQNFPKNHRISRLYATKRKSIFSEWPKNKRFQCQDCFYAFQSGKTHILPNMFPNCSFQSNTLSDFPHHSPIP